MSDQGQEMRDMVVADCHDAGAVKEGRVARPGTSQHAPCDDCHKAEFAKLALVLYLAALMSTRKQCPVHRADGLAAPLAVICVLFVLIEREPDPQDVAAHIGDAIAGFQIA